MRINLIRLSVVAVSAFGIGGLTVDRARAYVMRNPDGVYATLAFQFLVELEARRALVEGDGLALKRRLLLDDLVYRPTGRLKADQAAYDSSEDDGSTFNRRKWNQPLTPDAATAQQARKAAQFLQVGSKRFGRDVQSCEYPPPQRDYLDCLGRAVDAYADWIERTPPTPSSVAPVAVPALRETAARIRRASDLGEARAAVADATAVVRKSIDLVQAGGEDTVRRLEISQRSVVINSLALVDNSLVKAIGI